MTRIGILGATGYTALELIELLLRHPGAEITALTTRQEGEPHVASVHPRLAGRLDLKLENLDTADLAARADCVFSCLPHAASAEAIVPLLEAGVRCVDFSADYRLNSPEIYAKWYDHQHPDAERLGHVVYGLPELFREQIREAALVANPGCYPTSAILALAPLLKTGLIRREGIIVDSKSGVSGGGRTPKLNFHYPECNENFSAYGVGKHRHMPEIDQYLSQAADGPVEVIFTPHLVPMDRGILSTAYSVPTGNATEADLKAALREFYAGEPFVRVVDNPPGTKDVTRTNNCHIAVRVVRGRVITLSAIDNLIKGASGAAVQNFNLMFGHPETTGLL